MKYVVLIGRILFSLIFIKSGVSHFQSLTADYAAAQGVPMASVLVPISGLIAIAGGLSIAMGYKAKAGAWLLVIFLVPVTLMMHAFWRVTDPEQHQFQIVMFMRNLSMLGGALLITSFGAGPASIDARTPVSPVSTDNAIGEI